ncbi:cupin domain-containing protein [Sphingomonas sp. 35-24ZXX]|uniref:cupin domain-containing protein n=1 Tax=Sphingomonas sp. 35-24ZXX TaxID=1545915 RepID=UPI00053BEA4E|nr:cupin domain-containing protein [Sphingomonas sp. 35-24ZXX]
MRYVMTYHDAGKACLKVADEPAERLSLDHTPGMAIERIWSTAGTPTIGRNETANPNDGVGFLPHAGQTAFRLLTFPPDALFLSLGFDMAASLAEFADKMPEMARLREADDPAMHRTETVDYVIILEGEVWLEVDDGQQVLLQQHDIVIQNGTRHAWRNRSDKPVTMAVLMVGAERTT